MREMEVGGEGGGVLFSLSFEAGVGVAFILELFSLFGCQIR